MNSVPFNKKNKIVGEEFASNLDLRLSEYKLKQLDQEMNDSVDKNLY
ncbi:MAG: hypothetical protein ACE5HI_06625 [bacterium]